MRAIWENYAGWFHHRSTTELYDVPPAAVAADLVAAAGAEALVDAARARLDAGEPVAALHLTDIVLAADPGNADARAVAADAVALAARRQLELLGTGLAHPIDRSAGGQRDEPGHLRLLRRRRRWSPAAPAASATRSPPPSPTPGPR